MAELKTVVTDASVDAFLAGVDERRQADCRVLVDLMRKATGEEPRMWGASIVGFGGYRYHYRSGREGEWFLVGFSPRKQNLTLYLISGFAQFQDLLAGLGKHKTSEGSCIYVKSLADIDLDCLRRLVEASLAHMRATHENPA